MKNTLQNFNSYSYNKLLTSYSTKPIANNLNNFNINSMIKVIGIYKKIKSYPALWPATVQRWFTNRVEPEEAEKGGDGMKGGEAVRWFWKRMD